MKSILQTAYWAGRLIGHDQAWDIAQEIVEELNKWRGRTIQLIKLCPKDVLSAYIFVGGFDEKLTPPSVEQPSEQEELWKELWELKEKCGHFHHDYIIKQFSKEFCIYRKGSEPSVDGELLEVLKEAEQVLSKHYASHPVLTKIDNLLASRSAPKESI